jgi:hypothetical protein
MAKRLFLNSMLFSIIFLFFTGCQVGRIYERNAYNTHIVLLLDENNSFIKRMNINSVSDTFTGSWFIMKDTLNLKILKPAVFFNVDSLSKVEEHYLPDNDSIYFSVFFKNKGAAPYARIRINKSQEPIVTNSKGQAAIKKTKISSLHIYSLNSLPYLNYNVKDTLSNYFIIHLPYKSIFSYSAIRVEPITQYLIKRNKLIPLNDGNKKRKDYYLKRKFFSFSPPAPRARLHRVE